jgi:hypothetical protein
MLGVQNWRMVEASTCGGGFDQSGLQHQVQRNAFRGLWRTVSRTARRPFLAFFLRKLRDAEGVQIADPALLGRLRWAWANPNSASVEYLKAVAEAALSAGGPILECGSGLSTVIAGAIAQRTGNTLITLEHSMWWSRNVRWSLRWAGVTEVDYRVRPLRHYKDFDWYDPGNVPSDIALVICDGPPATGRGGRYGLVPLLAHDIAPGARTLLDDYDRPSEALVVDRWTESFGWSIEYVRTSDKGEFCSLLAPGL